MEGLPQAAQTLVTPVSIVSLSSKDSNPELLVHCNKSLYVAESRLLLLYTCTFLLFCSFLCKLIQRYNSTLTRVHYKHTLLNMPSYTNSYFQDISVRCCFSLQFWLHCFIFNMRTLAMPHNLQRSYQPLAIQLTALFLSTKLLTTGDAPAIICSNYVWKCCLRVCCTNVCWNES